MAVVHALGQWGLNSAKNALCTVSHKICKNDSELSDGSYNSSYKTGEVSNKKWIFLSIQASTETSLLPTQANFTFLSLLYLFDFLFLLDFSVCNW
jgi:hypothetical protein